jgi:uncharacterized membrane protein YfcA
MPQFLDLALPVGVTPGVAIVLILFSFVTSGITAAFGIGGGMVMLGALSASVPPATIIAVHGLVQFGSNIGRSVVQRDNIVWRPALLFMAGCLIGVMAGAWFITAVPTRLLLAILGLFILLMTWVPKPRIPGMERQGMVIGGAFASILSMFVGAVGPFVQALLLPLRLERRQLVATHSAMQTGQHLLKVLAFGLVGFSFSDWLPLTLAMIASGFLGTLFGTRLLDRMSAAVFERVLKGGLTLIALDLLRRAAGLSLPFG